MEYHPDWQNSAADALCRRDEDVLALHALSMPQFSWFGELRKELASSQAMVDLCARVRAGQEETAWSVADDLLLYDGKVFVLESSPLWPRLLVVHDSGA